MIAEDIAKINRAKTEDNLKQCILDFLEKCDGIDIANASPTALRSQFKSVRLVDSLIQLAICTGLEMLNPPRSAALGPFGTQAPVKRRLTKEFKRDKKFDKKRTKKRLIPNPLH